ncbi:MAG: AAA family ATPase [Rubritalea sp.]
MLWRQLKQISRELATSGGDLTRAALANGLRATFSLSEFPNYVSDWEKISADFAIRIDRIRDSLAGRLELSRQEEQLPSYSEPITALVGASGSGKTVLAKQVASRVASAGHAIWLTPADLNGRSLSIQFSDLRIRHSFPELVEQSIANSGVIVIDGIERLNQEGLSNLAVLLKLARIDSDSAWTFIFTSVVDAWERTHLAIKRAYGTALNVAVETVEFRFASHREQIVAAFPQISQMLLRPQLASVFSNLKMLDLVLTNAAEDTESNSWVGETDILEWYWAQHIQGGANGVARSRFMQKMACIEANEFLVAMPIDRFESAECQLAEGLISEQVIWNRDERFGFEHDLLGDWARARFLLSRQQDIAEIAREYSLNPRWHRPIRLFGLRLLEGEADVQQWEQLVFRLAPEDTQRVESDLVLESIVFAGNTESLLREVWAQLVADDGKLLNRLLSRFLHSTTLPDPRFASDPSLGASQRIPFWPLWLPVLRVLAEKRPEAIPIATEKVTHIADLWLKCSGQNWPLRNETGQILIDSAQFIIEEIKSQDWSADSDLCKSVFSRVLTAACVYPDEVAELALSLAERRDASPFAADEEVESVESELQDGEAEKGFGIAEIYGPRGPLSDPWPQGPLRRVDHRVHDGFLAGDNPLEHLFTARPEAGKEVLLALLIREPLPQNRNYSDHGIDDFLHVEVQHDWSPPMYFRGPFLSFLRNNRKHGVATIVELTNFVTDRWADNRENPTPVIVTSSRREEGAYFGSSDAYYWYRDSVQSPDAVVPALMALEQWLYLHLERDEPISLIVQQILDTSHSTALLGVLAAVGRREPKLFNNELSPLVPVWQLQVWEEHYQIEQMESSLHGMTMMQWSRYGESIWNIVHKWHMLEHRKTTLGNVLFQQFLTNEESRNMLVAVQKQWAKKIEEMSESEDTGFMERIALQFDESQLRMRRVENGIVMELEEPSERTERLAAVRENNEKHMAVLTFPMTCRKMIDERASLEPDQIKDFWVRLQGIEADADDARSRGDRPEDAIVGGIAALSVLHNDWLEADPEREKWCAEQFSKVLKNPPAHPQFHVPESVSNYHWDNFAAMLLPQMLAKDPTDDGIRAMYANFALAYNYSVTEDLMKFAYEQRESLGDDFLRLLHLIVRASGIRNINTVTHGGNSIWDCPDIDYDIGALFNELIGQFADSTLEPKLPNLCEVAENATDTIVEMVQKQHDISYDEPTSEEIKASIAKRIRRGRGFEPMQLRAAFSWLTEAESAADELPARIECLDNLLRGILHPLGGIEEALLDDNDDNSFFSTPGQWDTWIFDFIAATIPRISDKASAQRLWEPIMSFGLERVHWVDSFISSFFIHGLRIEGCVKNFFLHWKAMIAFAWTAQNWRQTEVRNHRSDDELFRHLMGFSSFGEGYFEDEKYRASVATMKPEFDKWTDEFFPHPKTTAAYARFLTFPSAVDYVRDGVAKLAEVSSQFEEWHWGDFYHLEHALLKLLEYDWENNSAQIQSDHVVRKQFSTILKTMSDRQVPQALELQDKMVRSK